MASWTPPGFPPCGPGSDYTSDIGATDEGTFEDYSLYLFAIAQAMSLISDESVALVESTALTGMIRTFCIGGQLVVSGPGDSVSGRSG